MITVICRLDFVDGPFSFNLTVKLRTLTKRKFRADLRASSNNVEEKCAVTATMRRMRLGYGRDHDRRHVMRHRDFSGLHTRV